MQAADACPRSNCLQSSKTFPSKLPRPRLAKMFSSSSASSSPVASPRSWADVVRNSPSPPTTPRPPAPAVVTSPPPAPSKPVAAGAAGGAGGAREVYFESDVQTGEASIMFEGCKHTMKYAVTKYGDFLTNSGTFGAFIGGKDDTIEQTQRAKAGNDIFGNLASRVGQLQHKEVQLGEHLQVTHFYHAHTHTRDSFALHSDLTLNSVGPLIPSLGRHSELSRTLIFFFFRI